MRNIKKRGQKKNVQLCGKKNVSEGKMEQKILLIVIS